MNDSRTYLHKGTIVTLESGDIYEITGAPVGRGGGSVIYPVERLTLQQGQMVRGGIYYVLKECYPVSSVHSFMRDNNGEIRPVSGSPDALDYLSKVKEMQLAEKEVTQQIYRTGSRLLPILDSSGSAELTYENRSFRVSNVYTVMESLASKGRSLSDCVEDYGHLTTLQTFHIVRQVLFALREIHQAGYLHLDIQGGNIFIKGTLSDESDILTLIDFGSARKLINGKTAPVADRAIFTTQGFSAPEILLRNDGALCLTPGADIYSAGCLLLFMLTGERYDTGQLIRNTSGRYLSNFKLRKIDCPRHLVDRMQRILARALAAEPCDRYHTADEMLSEISDFIKALRPTGFAVAAVPYDAFICYRHGRTDSRAALALQKNLEHFRPPRELLKGSGISQRRPFRRVFIDEGELSSCADLGGQIREALKNSAWLIVVCSPATPDSPWVKEEIDTFLQYHDRSRILAVLTEGEPDVSFPDRLLAGPRGQTEVLAADARGKDLRDILKKLRGDALLKLTAPMLGTIYDSLKQRHKVRLLQQITAAACMVMVLTGAFLAYAARQNQKIQEELTRTQISESRYMAKLSEEELAKGHRLDAIRTALSALPENSRDKSRPVVPEAVAALKSATYAYRKASPDSFFLQTDLKAGLKIGDQDLTVSSDWKMIAGLDTTSAVFIYDTEKRALLLSARPSDIDSSDTSSGFIDVEFLDDSRILLLSYNRLCCWDVSSERLLWSSGFPKEVFKNYAINDSSGMTVTQDRNHVYFMDSLFLSLYAFDCGSGELCNYLERMDETQGISEYGLGYSQTDLVLSPDEKTAIVGLHDVSYDVSYLQKDTYGDNFYAISLDTMELKTYHCAFPYVISCCFSGTGEVAVLSAVTSINGRRNLETDEQGYDYALEMINLAEMTPVWTSKGSATGDYYDPNFRIISDPASASGSGLLALLGKDLYFFESTTGTERDVQPFSSYIIDIERFSADRLVVCLEDGSIYEIVEQDGSPKTISLRLEASGSYSAAYKKPSSDHECEYFLKDTFGNGVMVVSNTAEDPSYTELDLSTYAAPVSNSSCSLQYLKRNDMVWRSLYFDDHLLLYKPLTDVPAVSIPAKSLENLLGFKDGESDPILYYVNSGILLALNLDTSENLFARKLPDAERLFGWDFLGWQGETIVLGDKPFRETERPCLYLFDTCTLKETPVYMPESRAEVKETAFRSQCGFIAAVIDPEQDYRKDPKPYSLWYYDISSGSWRSSEANSRLNLQTYSYYGFRCDGTMALSPDGRTMAIVSSGNIVIMDTVSDTVLGKLDINCREHCLMEFIDDKKLAVWDDTYYVSIWDTAERTMLSRTETAYRSNGFGNYLWSLGASLLNIYYGVAKYDIRTAVYSVDESGKMLLYLLLKNTYMANNEAEIFYMYSYGGDIHAGYYKPYTLDELIQRGHKLIGDP